MTLENTQTAITYQGTGFVAEYPLPFPVPAKEHIVLEGSDASGYPVSFNPGIDYQITQVRDDGRTLRPTGVKFAKPLPAGWRITLRRVLPLVQEHPFHNQGPYSPRILEQCLDKQMMVSQQLEAGIASVKKDLGGARENLENMKDRLARQEQMLLELGEHPYFHSDEAAGLLRLNHSVLEQRDSAFFTVRPGGFVALSL